MSYKSCAIVIALMALLGCGARDPDPTPKPLSAYLATAPATYYVSNAGKDTNPGTMAAPWASVAKVETILATLQPGNKVLFNRGDVWHEMLTLGDIPAHAVKGAPGNPVVFGAYGTGAKPKFDELNANPSCFRAVDSQNGNWAHFPVQYVTIDNFECWHPYERAIVFSANGANMPGITISNNYVHDMAYGCSHVNGRCAPPNVGDSAPPDWTPGKHTANTPTSVDIIVPRAGNPNEMWYLQTAAACQSGNRPSAWPQNTNSCTVKDGTCSWTCTGVHGTGYTNAVSMFDPAPGASDVSIIGNTVLWGGGHNLVQVHGVLGTVKVMNNRIGPGVIHETIDFKGVGNAKTPALVSGNYATCGWSLGECGCQNDINLSGNCVKGNGNVPAAYFTLQPFPLTEYVTYQNNVAYDVPTGFQLNPNAQVSGCPGPTACPIVAQYLSNTAIVTGKPRACALADANNRAGSSIVAKNNIFDGAVCIGSGYKAATEDHNNVGGKWGSGTFTFAGRSQMDSTDKAKVDPKYIDPNAGNFNLAKGSPMLNAGVEVGTGHKNIGAYAGAGE